MAQEQAARRPVLRRGQSVGGIPRYTGDDIVIKQTSRSSDRQHWFGPTEFEIQGRSWTLDEFKGLGVEGQVYMVTNKASGKKLVAKFLRFANSSELDFVEDLPYELVVHKNLVKYDMIVVDVGRHFPPAKHILFMEYIPNGDLFDILVSTDPSAVDPSVAGRPMSAGTSRRFLRDVISGMAACYRSNVTHRDVKPENLLIDETGRVVIVDMGQAKKGSLSEEAETQDHPERGGPAIYTTAPHGTPSFMAPEVLKLARYDGQRPYDCEPADVWSVGVVAFLLHAKRPCFAEAGGSVRMDQVGGPDNAVLWQILDSMRRYYPEFPEGLRGVINSLWRIEPLQRPSFEQLEKAAGGDREVLEQFPGLRWLSEPVNDEREFIDELRRSRPDLVFRDPPVATRRQAALGRLAHACGWCSASPQPPRRTPPMAAESPAAPAAVTHAGVRLEPVAEGTGGGS